MTSNPFIQKWNLKINRNISRENTLTQKIIGDNIKPTVVMHLEGSDIKLNPDMFSLDRDKVNVINITGDITNNIFDWLEILNGANTIITLDSVFTNLIDQLRLDIPKYFIKRSHINMTPVLGSKWEYLTIEGLVK